MNEVNNKKTIRFSAPLHISQNIKLSNGEIKRYIIWDAPERLLSWFRRLLPRIIKREVGAEYSLIREGYFHVGINGQLERIELPTVFEDEELVKNIALSIEICQDLTENVTNTTVMKLTQQ